jgi:hypothetical protein
MTGKNQAEKVIRASANLVIFNKHLGYCQEFNLLLFHNSLAKQA